MIRALVATDVLGRGVDIPGVTHVVIFDFPESLDTYIHRVGRTGRNGCSGTSVAFFEVSPYYPDLPIEFASLLRACGQAVPAELALEEELSLAARKSGYTGWDPSGNDAAQVASSDVLATSEELGAWHAKGARVWGYSTNGGMSEQGRLEFYAGGRLRTTWGWGEWKLQENGSTNTYMSISWNGCVDVCKLNDDEVSFEMLFRNGRPANSFNSKTVGRALPGATL